MTTHVRSTDRDVYLAKAAEIFVNGQASLIYVLDPKVFAPFCDAFSEKDKPMLGQQPPDLVVMQLCFYAAMLETDDG